MKILVYGAGVIGSIFAGKLSLSGNNVTVLARSKRYAELKCAGIVLHNPGRKRIKTAWVNVIKELDPGDIYDYIIVAMQKTQVGEILPALSANKSKNIVFVVNTADGYEQWKNAVGSRRLMLAFPSAGGEWKHGRIYYYVGRGLARIFQTTTVGEYSGKKTERAQALIKLFRSARIPSVFCEDMDAWQKTHVAMVTCIANALYGFGCDNYKLGASLPAVADMVCAIKESRAVLLGAGITPTPAKLCWLNLPTGFLARCFALFMKTRHAETMMAKHCLHKKGEMIALQGEFDAIIAASGVETPYIDKLRQNLLLAEKAPEAADEVQSAG